MTEDEVRALAREAGIEIEDERLGAVAAELEGVVEAAAALRALPLEGVEPLFGDP